MNAETVQMMALDFLSKGSDTIGVIDNEEKMAAALVFLALERDGYAIRHFDNSKIGPSYSITQKGRRKLEEYHFGESV